METRTVHPRTPAAAPAQLGRGGLPTVSSRLRTIVVIAVTAIAILVAVVLTNRPASAGGLTPVDLAGVPTGPAPIVGEPAPDFAATDVDGKAVRVSDFKGKVVWLTFGASWCQPCRAENPDIKASYEAFRDRGVVVLQVFISQDVASVVDYAGRVGIAYTKIADVDDQISTHSGALLHRPRRRPAPDEGRDPGRRHDAVDPD